MLKEHTYFHFTLFPDKTYGLNHVFGYRRVRSNNLLLCYQFKVTEQPIKNEYQHFQFYLLLIWQNNK